MLPPWSRTAALCLGVLALARPQFGDVEYNVNTLGVDIALVIDVSNSMQQQDFAPILQAAQAAKPDAFIAFSYPADTFGLSAQAKIAKRPAAYPQVLITSSHSGEGVPELRAAIAQLLAERAA